MTTLYFTNNIETKSVPMEYDWLTLLFGFWPSLFRGQWGIVGGILGLQVLTGFLVATLGGPFAVAAILSLALGAVFAATTRAMQARTLLDAGFHLIPHPSYTLEQVGQFIDRPASTIAVR